MYTSFTLKYPRKSCRCNLRAMPYLSENDGMYSSMNASRMIEPNTQSCAFRILRSCEAECHRSIARPWLPDRLAGLGAQPKEVDVQTGEFGDTIGERHGSFRAAPSMALTLTVVKHCTDNALAIGAGRFARPTCTPMFS